MKTAPPKRRSIVEIETDLHIATIERNRAEAAIDDHDTRIQTLEIELDEALAHHCDDAKSGEATL